MASGNFSVIYTGYSRPAKNTDWTETTGSTEWYVGHSATDGETYAGKIAFQTGDSVGASSSVAITVACNQNSNPGYVRGYLCSADLTPTQCQSIAGITGHAGYIATLTNTLTSGDQPTGTAVTFDGPASLSPNTTYYVYFLRNGSAYNGFCAFSPGVTTELEYTARYAVTYNANGGSGAPGTQYKIEGSTLTLSSDKPTRSSASSSFTITGNGNGGTDKSVVATKTIQYTFAGWAASSGGSVAYQPGESYNVDCDMSLYAVWVESAGYSNNTVAALGSTTRANDSAGSCRVTFNGNGGACTVGYLDAVQTMSYSFAGWGTTVSSGADLLPDSAFYGDTTVYAQWSGSTSTAAITLPAASALSRSDSSSAFTITGDGNGGVSKSVTATKTTSYIPTGWSTAASGGATDSLGASYTPTADMTLYAQWNSSDSYSGNTIAALGSTTRAMSSAGSYRVTLDANGGTCGIERLEAPCTTAYGFLGWGSSAGAANSLPVNTAYTADVTVYARWSGVTTPTAVTLPTPTRTGYEFLGWGASAEDASGVTGTYTPAEAVTLYAIWKANNAVLVYTGGAWVKTVPWIYFQGRWHRAAVWCYFDGAWHNYTPEGG